jgi:multicomponent Na+:H+ antiporter subunit C
LTSPFLYALAGASLFMMGLYALIAYDHLLRKILALNIMGSGVFLLLVGLARRAPPSAPDPVPHAMVITGIVVAVSATALALAFTLRLYERTGRAEFPEEHSDHD